MPNCLLFMAWDNNSCPSRAGTWISVIHKSNNFGHQNHLNCYICWYILKDDGSRTNSSVIPHINSLNGQVKTCLDKFPNISHPSNLVQIHQNPSEATSGRHSFHPVWLNDASYYVWEIIMSKSRPMNLRRSPDVSTVLFSCFLVFSMWY